MLKAIRNNELLIIEQAPQSGYAVRGHSPIEETEMPLYGGLDLHANNSVVVLLNDQDQVIYQKRSPSATVGGRVASPTAVPEPGLK